MSLHLASHAGEGEEAGTLLLRQGWQGKAPSIRTGQGRAHLRIMLSHVSCKGPTLDVPFKVFTEEVGAPSFCSELFLEIPSV